MSAVRNGEILDMLDNTEKQLLLQMNLRKQ